MTKIIALTGATGFLGRHILDALVADGYKVRALARRMQREQQQSVEWVRGSLNDPAALMALTRNADIVIHAAGLVKAKGRTDFFMVNRNGTERLLKCAKDNNIKRFLFISSLAAREPTLSHYAASKAAAESILFHEQWPFETLSLRPPAIYGPGDMEILKILKTVRYGFLPAPGTVNNRFSMIHAVDLAQAIVMLTGSDEFSRQPIIEIDDGKENGYSIPDVAEAIAIATNQKPVKCIPIPTWVLKSLGVINLMASKISSSTPMLTPGKAAELSHANWVSSKDKKSLLKGWSVQYDLTSGLKNTIDWYRRHKLL